MIVATETLDGYIIRYTSFYQFLCSYWKAKLANEFANLLVKRLNLEPPTKKPDV